MSARPLTRGPAGRLLVGLGTVEWVSGGPECLLSAGFGISRSTFGDWEHLFRIGNVDVMARAMLVKSTLGGFGALAVSG